MNSDYGFFSIFAPEFRPERSMNHELLHLLDASRNVLPIIKRIEREFNDDKSNREELIRLYLLELLIEVARVGEQIYAKRRKSEIVSFIESYQENRYQEPLDIQKLADETGYSKGYLFLFYKKKTGTTIGKTLFQIRMKHAQRLLKETTLTIEKICYQCGFSDPANFYRSFKAATGLNPSDLRK